MHRLFRFGILGLLTLAIIPSEDPLNANISTDIIGPFEKFQSDQIFTYNYSLNRNASNIHEELKIINDETGALCKKIVKAQHSFVRFSKEKVDFDIPLSKWFSDDGLHFRFSVFQNTTEISFVIAIIYPIEKKEFDLSKNNIKRLQSEDVAFRIKNSKVTGYADEFNFVGFKNYIDADNYCSLDLKGNRFIHNSDIFNYKNSYLIIYDDKRLLKYFSHELDKIIIPLKIIDDEEVKSFEFDKEFYVDRRNLESSEKKMNDFVKTNKLFLPVNMKNEFIGTKMQIVIKECGYNGYTLNIDLTYDVFRELIGNCNNSDFCIKGEIK